MNLYFDANSSSVRSKGRKIYFSSSQGMISFPFYCCHSEEELRKYVFFMTKGEDHIFYFKSKDYAELFAKINNLECQKVSNGTFEEQQMISKAKNAVEGNPLLVAIKYFLYGVGALLIVFSILALFSSWYTMSLQLKDCNLGALDRKSLDKQKRFKLKINQFFEIILKQKIIIEYFFYIE